MDRKKNLETCLIIVTGLIVIYLIKAWTPLLTIAGIIGLVGIFFDKPASWIAWLWFKLGDLLGKIVPKIVLSLVYFIVLSPIAFFYRLFSKDNVGFRAKNLNSMWIQRDHSYTKEDIIKPW